MERMEKWTEGEDIELIEYRMLGHEINMRCVTERIGSKNGGKRLEYNYSESYGK